MTSPELGIATQDNTATAGPVAVPPQAGVVISTAGLDDGVERAFEAAVQDGARLDDLLDVLARGRLWVPVTLGTSGQRALAEGAVRLPTVRYLGDAFVPGYTSATRLLRAAEELAPGERVAVIPHAVVRAADLARRLPSDLGIALNPGSSESVPIYPAGVAHLAADHAVLGKSRVSVGPVGVPVPGELLRLVRTGLGGVRAVRQAATAWLAVDRRGAGLVISVTLEDPADQAARDAALSVVQQAVTAAGGAGWPVDVTFPGEGEPDIIDRWVGTHATPFFQRAAAGLPAAGLPAPRPASS
jgi:hypothetical protein